MGPLKWKFLINFSLGEHFAVKMIESGGESMYHKTFGNMKHPKHQ